MARISYLLLVPLALASISHTAAFAADDDEKIIGVWERETGKDKDLMEESWVIKKSKDKWTVSGKIFNRGIEVGNFRGKDVKFKDGDITFTQDFFKLPKGFSSGAKITASAEEDRLDVAATKGKEETKYNMERAGDGSELIGTWKLAAEIQSISWTIEKDKKGELSIRGVTLDTKTGKELGNWKGINLRYFKHELMFNQQWVKFPNEKMPNGRPFACAARGNELIFILQNKGGGLIKNTLTKQAK